MPGAGYKVASGSLAAEDRADGEVPIDGKSAGLHEKAATVYDQFDVGYFEAQCAFLSVG